MKKIKTKPISYKEQQKNKLLSGFGKIYYCGSCVKRMKEGKCINEDCDRYCNIEKPSQ